MIAEASGAEVATAWAAIASAVLAFFAVLWGVREARQARADANHANQTAEKAAKEAERQANLAAQTLACSVRPLIAGVPKIGAPIGYVTTPDPENRIKDGDFAFYVHFPVRNVGPGTALVHDSYIEEVAITSFVGLDVQTLPSGGEASVEVTVPTAGNVAAITFRREIQEHGLAVVIRYSDAALGRRMLTRMSLRPRTDNSALVMDSLQVYECTDDWTRNDTPFAEM